MQVDQSFQANKGLLSNQVEQLFLTSWYERKDNLKERLSYWKNLMDASIQRPCKSTEEDLKIRNNLSGKTAGRMKKGAHLYS